MAHFHTHTHTHTHIYICMELVKSRELLFLLKKQWVVIFCAMSITCIRVNPPGRRNFLAVVLVYRHLIRFMTYTVFKYLWLFWNMYKYSYILTHLIKSIRNITATWEYTKKYIRKKNKNSNLQKYAVIAQHLRKYISSLYLEPSRHFRFNPVNTELYTLKYENLYYISCNIIKTSRQRIKWLYTSL